MHHIFFCRYGIKNVQVLAKSARMVVQDCAEAEENVDARDKLRIIHVHTNLQNKFSLFGNLRANTVAGKKN